VSTNEAGVPVRETDTVVHALSVFRHRWPVLLGAVLAILAAALAYRALSTDKYEASASVVFGAPSLSDAALQIDRGGGDPERDAATNVLIAESPGVADAVRKQLGVSDSASALLDDISVAAEDNANVLRVTAEKSDPKGAARLANAFADQYIAFKARSEVQSIEAAESDLRRQLNGLPAGSAQRENLQQSLERLATLRAVATGGARIIGNATPPSEPSTLGLAPLVVLSIILGLGLGLTAVFVLESTDRRVKAIEELEREYGLPALAGVPQSAFQYPLAKDRGEGLEPYRILRSALEFSSVSRELDVVMVTSAVPGEGKTTVAVDLAQAIALSGRQVVLVELDLRRPTFAQQFDIDTRQGVTTALTQREPVSALLQQPVPGLPRLLVLPSGRLPPNPSELLSSPVLTELLEELAGSGAMVIVDAPPLLPVADAQVLLNHTVINASLIVARVGTTTRDEARRAKAILDRHLLRPLGLVVTGLRKAERYGYASYASEEPDEPAAVTVPARRRIGNRR
jgi:succinoglycan biosynthesis transport protein ExoP